MAEAQATAAEPTSAAPDADAVISSFLGDAGLPAEPAEPEPVEAEEKPAAEAKPDAKPEEPPAEAKPEPERATSKPAWQVAKEKREARRLDRERAELAQEQQRFRAQQAETARQLAEAQKLADLMHRDPVAWAEHMAKQSGVPARQLIQRLNERSLNEREPDAAAALERVAQLEKRIEDERAEAQRKAQEAAEQAGKQGFESHVQMSCRIVEEQLARDDVAEKFPHAALLTRADRNARMAKYLKEATDENLVELELGDILAVIEQDVKEELSPRLSAWERRRQGRQSAEVEGDSPASNGKSPVEVESAGPAGNGKSSGKRSLTNQVAAERSGSRREMTQAEKDKALEAILARQGFNLG